MQSIQSLPYNPWCTYITASLLLLFHQSAFGLGPRVQGIKAGKFVLSPSINLETHAIHNPGRMPFSNTQNDFSLSINPRLDIQRNSDSLHLNADLSLMYSYYLHTKQFRTWTGQASIDGVIYPNRALTLRFNESFERTDIPATQSLLSRYIHNSNLLSGGLEWKLGDGALIVDFEYAFWFDLYDRTSPNSPNHPELLDNIKQLPQLIVKWKFFPKTAAFIETRGRLTHYLHKDPFRQIDQVGQSNLNAYILSVMGGVIGQLSHRFEIKLKLGYANTFLEKNQYDDNFESWIGNLQLTYRVSPTMQYHFGLERSVKAASFFGYMNKNSIDLQGYWMLWRHIQLHVRGSYHFLQFGHPVAGLSTQQRQDHQVIAETALHWHTTRWLAISLANVLEYRNSNYTPHWIWNNQSQSFGPITYLFNDVVFRIKAQY